MKRVDGEWPIKSSRHGNNSNELPLRRLARRRVHRCHVQLRAATATWASIIACWIAQTRTG